MTTTPSLDPLATELAAIVAKGDTLTDADLDRGEALVAEALRKRKSAALRAALDDAQATAEATSERTPTGALRAQTPPGFKATGEPHPWAKALVERAGGNVKAALPAGQVLAVPATPPIFGQGQVPTSVLSLVSLGTIGEGNAVPFFQQTARTNAAAVVPHGDLKPTSVYGLTRAEAPVVTVAHLSEPIARQDLDDLPGLSEWLERELLYGLGRELEDEVVGGAGTSTTVSGILDTTGVLAVAFATSVLQTLRAAIAAVVAQGWAPTAVALNPTDDAALDLSADTAGRLYASPFESGSPSVWGIRRVSSPEVPAGTAIVGDFSTVRVGMRETANVLVTDAGPELFDHNMVKARAELRAAVMVTVPSALAIADLTA